VKIIIIAVQRLVAISTRLSSQSNKLSRLMVKLPTWKHLKCSQTEFALRCWKPGKMLCT